MFGRHHWTRLLAISFAIVVAWPPENGRSLALTAINWAVDPWQELPVLPPQLGYGLSDDPQAVEARDELVRRFDAMEDEGGVTRWRLRLKGADDPFAPATERQLLLLGGLIAAYLLIRPE